MIAISFSDSIKQHMKCYMKRSLFSSSSYVVFIRMCLYTFGKSEREWLSSWEVFFFLRNWPNSKAINGIKLRRSMLVNVVPNSSKLRKP